MTRISHERLVDLLHYDEVSGVFTWKADHGKRVRAGQIAGCKSTDGRVVVGVDGKIYRAHRLAFFWMTGEWPIEVDHKDHDQANNAWANLRSADHSFNQQNMVRAQKNNRSGFLGVSYQAGRWFAKIYAKGKKVSLGGYSSPEAAHHAYVEAKRKLHAGGVL